MVHILTGVKPNLKGAFLLKGIYNKIFRTLEKFPKHSAYRINTEAIVSYRLSVVNQSETNDEIESALGCGSIGMLISEANAELDLCNKMLTWKPWEPLMRKPPPGQWKWPPVIK